MIEKFKNYFLNLILIWVIILLYRLLPYYKNFLRTETQIILLSLALIYTTLGFVYYLFVLPEKIKETKGSQIFNLLKKLLNCKTSKIDSKEKTAFLFVIVKIFFLPLMINFFLNNFFSLKNQLPNLNYFSAVSPTDAFNLIIFPLILTLIFFADTLWFTFGYTVETKFLKNKIRSVEPTILGWVVALICYPPFNSIVTGKINWYASEYVLFSTTSITLIFRILILLFLGIYVSASFALGAKCSNLTNRGIVSRGPYSIVRHPAYISKNIAWWITLIPVMSLPAILSMGTWTFIYHLRTITEEKHLMNDPEYQEYCKKVKYKYIPFIY